MRHQGGRQDCHPDHAPTQQLAGTAFGRRHEIRCTCPRPLHLSGLRVDVPHELNVLIPHTPRPYQKGLEINNRRIRCIVKNWDGDFIRVDIDQDADEEEYLVQLKDEENHIDHTYLWDILKEGMQLNLLDCRVKQPIITPRLIVVEPDYLVDISSIATCFTAFGHHPLLYLLNFDEAQSQHPGYPAG